MLQNIHISSVMFSISSDKKKERGKKGFFSSLRLKSYCVWKCMFLDFIWDLLISGDAMKQELNVISLPRTLHCTGPPLLPPFIFSEYFQRLNNRESSQTDKKSQQKFISILFLSHIYPRYHLSLSDLFGLL